MFVTPKPEKGEPSVRQDLKELPANGWSDDIPF